jgi:arginase
MSGEVATRTLRVLGVPMDLGQERRGVDMDPSAIRYARLGRRLRTLGHRVIDGGNLSVPQPETESAERAASR